MKYDNIHFTCQVIDSYNKPFNLVQSCRSSGKTTDIFRKVYKAYKDNKHPSLVLRRQIVDITESYIDDIAKVINKFLDNPIHFFYHKGDMKAGITDIYLSMDDLKNKTDVFLRIIGLNAKKQRLKGGVLMDVKYLVFDEFMIDLRHNEKYLPDEISRFEELYTTYNREALTNIRCYFLGNAYSYYSPYHAYFKIDANKIKMGCVLTTSQCCFQLFKPSDELIELLKENPLFDVSDEYEQYALFGIPVNDNNIKLEPIQPQNFKLFNVFKINGVILGIFYNNGNYEKDFTFWVSPIKWSDDYKRIAFVFDLRDVSNASYIPTKSLLQTFIPIKKAMMQYKISYKDINASYTLEMIFSMLPSI